jgi:signal transduction histidine kinase
MHTNPEMMNRSWRVSATLYYVLLAAIGLSLLLPHLFWLGHNAGGPIRLLTGTLIPVALAASLWGGVVWLRWHTGFAPRQARKILVWTIAILLFGTGIAAMIIIHGMAHDIVVHGVAPILINSASGGAVVGFLLGAIAADRERKAELLQERRQRVRSLNERLLVLNRVLRHDIRNDINVIRGHVDMLASGRADPADTIDVIRSKAEEIESLSERARDIERLLRSDHREVQTVDLVALLEREIAEVEDGYFGVEITTDLPDTATAEASPFIESVFDNLIENAVEHNDKPTAEIDISLTAENDQYRIDIADNGPGLPDHERSLLNGSSESPLEHSDGVGLWLVDWIVDESDGTVDIRDNSPGGTRIIVRLPKAV